MRHFERANKNTGDEALGTIQFSAHRVQPRPFTLREKHVACRLGYGSLQRGIREPPERGGIGGWGRCSGTGWGWAGLGCPIPLSHTDPYPMYELMGHEGFFRNTQSRGEEGETLDPTQAQFQDPCLPEPYGHILQALIFHFWNAYKRCNWGLGLSER